MFEKWNRWEKGNAFLVSFLAFFGVKVVMKDQFDAVVADGLRDNMEQRREIGLLHSEIDSHIDAENRSIEENRKILNVLKGSTGDEDWNEPGLSISDKVAVAMSHVRVQLDSAEERFGRTRVNLLVGLLEKVTLACGFDADNIPSPSELIDYIKKLRAANQALQANIKDILSFEAGTATTEVKGKMIGIMLQFLKMLLDGEMNDAIPDSDYKGFPAPNHVSFIIGGPTRAQTDVEVVVRRINGKTDTQLRLEAQASLAFCQEQLALYREFATELQKTLEENFSYPKPESLCNVCVYKKLDNGVDCPNCCADELKPTAAPETLKLFLSAVEGKEEHAALAGPWAAVSRRVAEGNCSLHNSGANDLKRGAK